MPKARPAPAAIRHRNLPLLLLQGRESVIARFRPLLNDVGLTEQQWRILRVLVEQGALEPREIVERCRISSPSLTGVLARMDELGLVHRERPGHDQRRLIVQATPKARRIAADLAPRIEATYAALEQRLGAAFLGRLYETLDQLVAMLDDGGGVAAPPVVPVAQPPATPRKRPAVAAPRSGR